MLVYGTVNFPAYKSLCVVVFVYTLWAHPVVARTGGVFIMVLSYYLPVYRVTQVSMGVMIVS